MDDADFKPKDPDQTKEEACWALCNWLDSEGKLKDSAVPNWEDLLVEAAATLEESTMPSR
jgi:hypothetical protein